MEKILPKKSLGQNFLIDKNISRKIISSLDCNHDDVIIEIGCGTGALTELILFENPKFLFSFDIDKRAVETVSNQLSKSGKTNYEILHSDIREVGINELINKKNYGKLKVKVVGNIPYNISADILFWIFEQRDLIDIAIIMVQKEVAQRLTAKPNSKLYGITTVAMNLTGTCKALFDVSPKCFYPVPKVTSTVLKISPVPVKFSEVDFDKIMILVKTAFNQRRKVLKNALNSFFIGKNINMTEKINSAPKEILKMFSMRAEQLDTTDFITLYKYIAT